MALDGWTDYASFATIAFTAVCDGKAYLIKFQRISVRETGEFISQEIKTVMESLQDECVRVVGVVADNARNMQNGVVLTIPEGVLQLNCYEHTQPSSERSC